MKNIARCILFSFLLTLGAALSAATFNLFSPATGILVGNASSYVTSAATSSNVVGLWTGTCDNTTYLRGDGSCQTPPGTTVGANPSATIGLSAVNGSAGTYLRSDGAPALSQAIIPTWTGVHTFSEPPIFAKNANGSAIFQDPGASLNEKSWTWRADGGEMKMQTLTDAGVITQTAIFADRTGTTVDRIDLRTTASGTNAVSVDSSVTAGQTRLLVYDVDNGTTERVTVGAADSCGAGFKCLRIPN